MCTMCLSSVAIKTFYMGRQSVHGAIKPMGYTNIIYVRLKRPLFTNGRHSLSPYDKTIKRKFRVHNMNLIKLVERTYVIAMGQRGVCMRRRVFLEPVITPLGTRRRIRVRATRGVVHRDCISL